MRSQIGKGRRGPDRVGMDETDPNFCRPTLAMRTHSVEKTGMDRGPAVIVSLTLNVPFRVLGLVSRGVLAHVGLEIFYTHSRRPGVLRDPLCQGVGCNRINLKMEAGHRSGIS